MALALAVPAVAPARHPTPAARPSADSPAHAEGEQRRAAASSGFPQTPNGHLSTAPSGPPLTSAASEPPAAGAQAEAQAPSPPATEMDPLVSNGLASPACSRPTVGELAAAERRHCETSGFVAAQAPTGNYGIDVHIDTGVLGVSSGGLLSIVQDLFVTPLWMALVWATHALVVMLEWGFSIDLLPASSLAGLGGSLRAMELRITQPWLAAALAGAGVRVAYRGLVRRRIAETVAEAALMLAMMLGGLWVVLDPGATVGALSALSGRAALGTFAVATRGSPERAAGSFASAMDLVFSSAVEAPWCYLEFGDVGWCREPSRLDGRLRSAAQQIAAAEHLLLACPKGASGVLPCVPVGSTQADSIERSERMLREAHTNGAIFLALPPNGSSRNSINEPASLLHVLCQSSSISSCHGPGAAAAAFRDSGATWSRVGGLLLIALGLLGMLLLLGFIALRLLAAAVMSLVYVLLAPAMVLAPTFGERGRELFGRWASQLVGAVVAKLVFSFLLGVMLAVLAVIASFSALGWWTQWLLMSALWWGAFLRRHQAVALTGGRLSGEPAARRRVLPQRLRYALDPSRRLLRSARAGERQGGRPPTVPFARPSQSTPQGAGAEESRDGTGGAGTRFTHFERDVSGDDGGHREGGSQEMDSLLGQRERIERAREQAAALGDTRRAAELAVRGARVEETIARARGLGVDAGVHAAEDRPSSERAGGDAHADERRDGRGSEVIGEARRSSAPRRADVAATPARAMPATRAAARSRADRETAAARAPLADGRRSGASVARSMRRAQEREQLDREVFSQREAGRRLPRGQEVEPLESSDPNEWSVMWDIREVAAGRKRQFGRHRE